MKRMREILNGFKESFHEEFDKGFGDYYYFEIRENGYDADCFDMSEYTERIDAYIAGSRRKILAGSTAESEPAAMGYAFAGVNLAATAAKAK